METNEEVLERTLKDLSGVCGHFAVVKGTVLICSRHNRHLGKCRFCYLDAYQDVCYAWWGVNPPDIPGSEIHVWKTVGPKSTLMTRDGKESPWPTTVRRNER